MRRWFPVVLMLASCNGGEGTPTPPPPSTPPPTWVDADVGLDERPANPSCVAPAERHQVQASISSERVFDTVSLSFPVGMAQAPGDPDRWYVIEQGGRLRAFDADQPDPTAQTLLDLSSVIVTGGELGLLGLAFHPDWPTDPRLFLHYTKPGPVSVLASVRSEDGGQTFDPTSRVEHWTVNQDFSNHNGGAIAFGLDGMLYWGLGDGGGAGDPLDRAQDLGSPLGSILRLDVSGPAQAVVPADNPFVDVPGADPAIYAYGLRNPWRLSVDPATGDLWAGDVGQNAREEVNRVQAGGNYGWPFKEGNLCYSVQPCDIGGLIDPVIDYPQDPGFSVIGGVVYRGQAMPELRGTYLFSDYYHGRILAIVYRPDGTARRQRLHDTDRSIVAFATDAEGEVYVLDHPTGAILKLVPADPPDEDAFPRTLTATGCVDPDQPLAFADGVIPYQLRHPFWSDGADKLRGLALPDGAQIAVDPDTGALRFPVGTVLLKTFLLGDEPVETRLFMRHDEDVWAGYSYAWRADGGDADLVSASERVDVDAGAWTVPDRGSCLQCHTAVTDRTLGLELIQLDRDAEYPSSGRRAPQLATWAHIGLLDAPLPPDIAALPALDDDDASVESRARAYLHVNCAQCHQPGGTGRGELDLRVDTPLASMGLCDVAPLHGDLGIGDARLIAPGDAGRSVLLARLRDPGAYRMPPSATSVIDAEGSAVVEEWIAALPGCP